MRRNRLHIGNRGAGRRRSPEVFTLRPIADNNAWSASGSLYTNINEQYFNPQTPTDLTNCVGTNGTDAGVVSKWYFGGLCCGSAEIKRIEINVLVSNKSGDSCTNNFVIKGVSTATQDGTSGWLKDIIRGSWRLEDFMNMTADYTNGPYYSASPVLGNSKDTKITNLYIQLFNN